MSKKNRLAIFALLVAAFTATTMAQGDWKKTLEQALEETIYVKTGMSNLQRNNVTKPGTIFTVQKEGIVADRVEAFGTIETRINVGNPSAPSGVAAFLFSRSSSTTLKAGERVYLFDVDVKDDRIVLNLLTVEMYDINQKGNTEHTRLKSGLRFDFDKALLATADPATLKKVFDAIIKPESEVQAAATATKTLGLGQTPEEVEASMGKPETVINLGPKMTYVYKNMKVIFVDGKVADVQ